MDKPTTPPPAPAPNPAPAEAPKRPGFFRRTFRTLLLLVLLVLVGIAGYSMHLFMQQTTIHGVPPWRWNGAQWQDWTEFALGFGKDVGQQAVEQGKKGVEAVKAIDWGKLKETISTKTQELFGKTEEVSKKIESQRVKKEANYAPKYDGEAGQNYDYGLQAMEEGLRWFKVSITEGEGGKAFNPTATAKALKYFQQAVNCFQDAKKGNPNLPDVDMFLAQAQEYLKDCQERKAKIDEIVKKQPK